MPGHVLKYRQDITGNIHSGVTTTLKQMAAALHTIYCAPCLYVQNSSAI